MKTKIRIQKKWWLMVHLLLLSWIAWIAGGIADSAIVGKLGSVAPESASKSITAPLLSLGQVSSDYNYIIRRNIFNSNQSAEYADKYIQQGAPVIAPPHDQAESAPKTSLELILVGTVFGPDGAVRFAAIQEGKSGEQQLYKIGDDVTGATIVGIERNRALLRHNGKIESLEIDFSKGAKVGGRTASLIPRGRRGSQVSRVGKGEFLVSKKYLESQLANMNKLLTQVRAVPYMDKNGNAKGFKLYSIKGGSVFSKLGLRNKDVVQRVNGVELNSVESGLELFQALRNESSFEVDILRNRGRETLRFNLE